MPKKKYDRAGLKLEFFESDINEVKPFFVHKYNSESAYTRQVAWMTKWRWKEKQAYKEAVLHKSMQKNINKRAKELEIPVEALKESKLRAVWKIMEMLEMKDLSMKDLALWLEKIKTELWEPERIGANYNVNANKLAWLSDEELQALDVIFWKWSYKKSE